MTFYEVTIERKKESRESDYAQLCDFLSTYSGQVGVELYDGNDVNEWAENKKKTAIKNKDKIFGLMEVSDENFGYRYALHYIDKNGHFFEEQDRMEWDE